MRFFEKNTLLLTLCGSILLACTPETNSDDNNTEDQTIPVESVSMKPTSAKLFIDESLLLNVTIMPENATDKDIIWTVDNKSVASVEDGVVKAKSVGSARITATVQNKSAYCNIQVEKKENEAVIEVKEVIVEPSVISLSAGTTATIKATLQPQNAVATIVWSSNDPDIAEISDEGLLSAKKEGKTRITAKAGGKSGVCEVTVTKKVIPVTSVTLSPASLTLNRGGTARLQVTVLPDNATYDALSWESEKPQVATVDENGKVTGISSGTALVYARAGGKSDSCTISVIVAVTGISLNRAELSLMKGGFFELKATVLPEDASDKSIKWDSTDKSVATVTNGKVTAVGKGSAKVYASCGDFTAECIVTVSDVAEGGHEGTGEEDWN